RIEPHDTGAVRSRVDEGVHAVPLALCARVLDQDRDALAAADAGRGDAEALLAAPQLQHERQDQTRARRAERVPERDRAAVDVDLVTVQAELLLAAEVLGREGLVDLDEVDVGELHAAAL